MKRRTQKIEAFLESLHQYIVSDPQFRKDTRLKNEQAIQTELRPVILNFLKEYFQKNGLKKPYEKAVRSFYWEGQEQNYPKSKLETFSSRNYPDFVITSPYLVAIEYKQSDSGSVVKHGIGQSLIHTISGEFDFAYFLMHDQNIDKAVAKSIKGENEQKVVKAMWDRFNVYIHVV